MGIIMLSIIWGIAFIGMIVKIFWIHCPKWFSSILYISMGWTCVIAFTQLLDAMSPQAFGLLLGGGIVYTLGGVLYALKLKVFKRLHRNFGSHEIFHVLVMGGSVCHFIMIYAFILP